MGCMVNRVGIAYIESGEKLVGQVKHELAFGSATFEMETEDGLKRCEGKADRPYESTLAPTGSLCAGQKGIGRATCNDGTTFNFTWQSVTCSIVVGYGQDSLGNRMCFLMAKNEAQADDYVKSGLLRDKSICDPSLIESVTPVNEPKVIPI